jgi:hypothetical protein
MLNLKILLDSIQSIEKRAILLLVLIQKKEVLGNLYRPGTLYTTETVTTLDHDFWSLGHGKVILHGIYDSQENRGYITLGNSKDTSEFACECLTNWWNNYGKSAYPNATSILAKCDGGVGK